MAPTVLPVWGLSLMVISVFVLSHIPALQTVEAARAEAERIKRIGEADAYSVEAVGKAEAESMKLKAGAYKQYGEAAIMSMVLEALPQVGHTLLVLYHMCLTPNGYGLCLVHS